MRHFAREDICPEQEVKDQLEILSNSKPSGPDGVAPRILRSVSQCHVSALTLLCNQSLQCGQLPCIWKRSHVTHVYKNKGTAFDITNFRPIVLTCVLCKMIEQIIVKHFHNYVLEHHIITENQSGFQPKDSTVNQLVYIYNTIISNLDIGKDIRFKLYFVIFLKHSIGFGIQDFYTNYAKLVLMEIY